MNLNLILIVIIFLVLVVLLLMVALGLVIYLLYKKSKSQTVSDPNSLAPSSFQASKVEESFFCKNHKDEASVGSCLICEEVFCKECLSEIDGLSFCKEHATIYVSTSWRKISDIKTTPQSPEEGIVAWEKKRQVWKSLNIPSYIVTHYKINIEDDFIESYVQLHVPEGKEDFFKLDK